MRPLLQIVRDYLAANGYDGLWNADGDCACTPDDLSPGNCLTEDCEPGYEGPCNCGEHDFHIGREKPAEQESK